MVGLRRTSQERRRRSGPEGGFSDCGLIVIFVSGGMSFVGEMTVLSFLSAEKQNKGNWSPRQKIGTTCFGKARMLLGRNLDLNSCT